MSSSHSKKGETFSHYQILEKIGTGGMGEIFRARDTKLRRHVAIKFLSEELTGDPEARRRFIQEAMAASSLDHPNICTIHEVDEIPQGRIFIAMAYYEGETLKQRLSRGPLPLAEALDIVNQACRGLAKAHEAGIVHRDVKPANIMITRDGTVKILDFGLAKLSGRVKVTRTGTTLGTVAYLSPEQAQGRKVDRRADIWSLGVVFYEMISGRLPFKGDSEWSMMRAIADEKPEPVRTYCSNVSPEIVHIIEHSLEKDPADRYSSCEEMLADCAKVQGERVQVIKVRHRFERPKWLRGRIALPVLLLLGICIYFLIYRTSKSRSLPPMRTIPITTTKGAWYGGPRISPDGRQIAFCFCRGAIEYNFDVYIQLVGTNTPNRLTTHPGFDFQPAWSPDGRRIAFIRYASTGDLRWFRLSARMPSVISGGMFGISEDDMGIYIMSALGGDERKVHELDKDLFFSNDIGSCLDWSPDGLFLAYNDRDSLSGAINITLLSTTTWRKRGLTSPPQGVQGDILQRFSPDGRFMAFVRCKGVETNDLYIIPVTGGEEKRLTTDNRHIIGLDWTKDGRELIFSSNRGGVFKLWRISRRGGRPNLLAAGIQKSADVAVSRTDNKLIFVEERSDNTIWKCPMPQKGKPPPEPFPFITSTEADQLANFSPDGKRIVFRSRRSGNWEIWMCDAEGKNPVQLTFFGGQEVTPVHWSPDGRSIAFSENQEGQEDIFTLDIEDGSHKRITTDPSNEIFPNWSRDGKWIYFSSNRTGKNQLYKIPSEGGHEVQLTTDGGMDAWESADGKWIYYNQDNSIFKISRLDGRISPFLGFKALGYYWCLMENDIYYITVPVSFLYRFNLNTGINTKLMLVDVPNIAYPAVSPDRSCFLFFDGQVSTSIFLVDNFR
jgi:serine/threonine protein kinase